MTFDLRALVQVGPWKMRQDTSCRRRVAGAGVRSDPQFATPPMRALGREYVTKAFIARPKGNTVGGGKSPPLAAWRMRCRLDSELAEV